MSEQDGNNVEPLEEPPELAKMPISDESETPGAALNRAVRATEYLAVRHAMPKTNISNVILYENTSQERHLVRQLSSLTLRRERQKNVLDLQRRAFVQKQTRKQKKWKREDEFNLNNMNLPLLNKKEDKRPRSMTIIYKNPDYEMKPNTGDKADERTTLPPLVEVKREKTEIVFHKEKTFITKVPMAFSLNQTTLKHHIGYCGKQFLSKGEAAKDRRFQKLDRALAPNKTLDKKRLNSKRRSSVGSSMSYQSSLKPFKRRKSTVVVPMKRSTDDRSLGLIVNKSIPKFERSNTEQTFPSTATTNKHILQQFKTGDIRKLSKNLSAS